MRADEGGEGWVGGEFVAFCAWWGGSGGGGGGRGIAGGGGFGWRFGFEVGEVGVDVVLEAGGEEEEEDAEECAKGWGDEEEIVGGECVCLQGLY